MDFHSTLDYLFPILVVILGVGIYAIGRIHERVLSSNYRKSLASTCANCSSLADAINTMEKQDERYIKSGA